MPRLAATTTVTQTITIRPSVQRKLLTELRAWAELKEQLDAIEAAMKEHLASVEAVRDELGVPTFDLEGFKVTRVPEGENIKLDKKKLLEAGVSFEQLEAGEVRSARSGYTRITVAKEPPSGGA